LSQPHAFVRVYPRETQEMVFDAHDRAFALFKGACGRGIYDNIKTAVDKFGSRLTIPALRLTLQLRLEVAHIIASFAG
jgi:transposase